MSVRLESYQTVMFLPNPSFGDSEGLAAEVDRKFSMNGTRYTYVTPKEHRRLQMQFDLTRQKGLELQAFIQAYYGSEIHLTDHEGVAWVGYFTVNPFEFETPVQGEYQNIQIQFEGTQQ